MVPLIAVRDQVDEARIADDMAQGARDTVSLQQPGRLQAVIARELRAFRLERTLAMRRCAPRRTIAVSSKGCCSAPTMPSRRSRRASWWTPTPPGSSCSASPRPRGLVGQPVMDLFEEATHAPLKAALHGLPAGTLEQPHAQGRRAARRRLGGAARTGAGARRIRRRAGRAADRRRRRSATIGSSRSELESRGAAATRAPGC